MKRFKKLVIGGIQTRIFNLILVTVLVSGIAFLVVTLYHGRIQKQLSEETGQRQWEAVAEVTDTVMDAVVEQSMERTIDMQATASDALFQALERRVKMLGDVASRLFSEIGTAPAEWAPPDPAKDGEVTVQTIVAPGVRPEDIADRIGRAANMGPMMTAMFRSSAQANSCFVALPEGAVLVTDDRSTGKFDENGEPISFDPRTRPWYQQAVEAGELIITDVEEDAFTGDVGVVCAMPVYVNGELTAVVGSDLFLTSMRDAVEASEEDGAFLCVVNGNGHVVFSPRDKGVLKVMPSDEAWDLRENANEELAALVSDAMEGRTGVREVELVDGWYYMMGAPMDSVDWIMLSAVSRKTASQPLTTLENRFSEIAGEATENYRLESRASNTANIVMLAVLLVIAGIVALLQGRKITQPLNDMATRISHMRGEQMEFRMEDSFRTGDEIEVLAESFADLSHKTVQYVENVRTATAEKERLGTELDMATRIQTSMLPHVFPAFPERTEFDIYASMDPAKAVGGDFYDFFLIDDDHLCMVIADVSGKGVPAALFMMACKIILQSVTMLGSTPAKALTRANEAICSNNQEEMFITIWLGILEISTGRLVAANAGHEYPALMEPDGRFEIYRDKHGLVVGAMEGIKYTEYELQLRPGSRLFVYTDGVPEAMDAENELFGLERMTRALNKARDGSPEEILARVRRDMDRFVKDAEQFDDVTMLCLEYKGKEEDDHE